MSSDKFQLYEGIFDENLNATYHKKIPRSIFFGSLKSVVVEHPEIIGVFLLINMITYVIFILLCHSGTNWLSTLISVNKQLHIFFVINFFYFIDIQCHTFTE